MNKLLGFYELKDSSLPTIEWEQYTGKEYLSNDCLWTIRTAVYKGEDLNLPRFVGVNSEDANKNIKKLFEKFKDNGIVIYYPFFIAEKSGTLNVFRHKVVIEAVQKDLWNLVTDNNKDVTIIKETSLGHENRIGNADFLSNQEITEIMKNVPKIKHMFKDYIIEGKSILLEWSFAYNCDSSGNFIGNKHLIFYEARAI